MVLAKWHSPTGPKSITTFGFNEKWEELFDSFFYKWPKETKPPIESYSVYNEENTSMIGVRIQMALAGFSKEDIEVWFDEEEMALHVKGSNKSKEGIVDRFKCEFDHTMVYSSKLNVSEAKVTLENGMLDIFIPIIEPKNKKIYLFGK